jgi:hypothetical protein
MDKKYNFRIEEVPTIGQFVLDSYLRDEADFKAFSPDFNAAYKNDYIIRLNAVKDIVNSKVYTAEIKTITNRIYENLKKLKLAIDRLEAYSNLAKNLLTVEVSDFKFKEIRQKANKKDIEGLLELLKIMLKLTQDNFAALQSKGFTTEAKTEIENLRTAFANDNAEQNVKLDQRRQQVANNTETINDFYEKLSDLIAIGKVLYKKTNPEKAKSYTLTSIQRRLRNERKTNAEEM